MKSALKSDSGDTAVCVRERGGSGRVRVCSRIPRYCSAAGNVYALGNVQSKKLSTITEDAQFYTNTNNNVSECNVLFLIFDIINSDSLYCISDKHVVRNRLILR